MIRFDRQAAIVTGAGGGIGRAIAKQLAARGAMVLVNNRTPERAHELVREIRDAGGTAVANTDRVGDPGAGWRIAEAAIDAFGRIDVLVNNAAVAMHAPIAEAGDGDIEQMVRVNVVGPIELVRAVWPRMVDQRYGRILNQSSGSAYGVANSSVYAATKASAIGLTNCLALEGEGSGILVNTVFPMARTALTSGDAARREWMRANMPPELVAPAVLYFVSRECTLNGIAVQVGGGKVNRVALVGGPSGIFDRELTPEIVGDNLERLHDLSEPVVIPSARAVRETFLYTSEFPPLPTGF